MKANTYIREVETVFKPFPPKPKKVVIKSPQNVYELFKDLKLSAQEKFIALHLANDNSVLCFQIVSIGTLTHSLINPADILRSTLLTGASGIICIHNHPSGKLEPSTDDKSTTLSIKQACKIFDIRLLDHIIIGHNNYYSFTDNGDLTL